MFRTACTYRPFLRFIEPTAPTGEENPEGAAGGATPKPKPPEDKGFPANTPIVDMTVEQRAKYWEHQSKKHEKNRKPDNLADLQAKAQKLDQIENDAKSPDQKAIDAARAEGLLAGRRELLPAAIAAELRAQVPTLTAEEVTEIVDDLNLDKFMTADGGIDMDRVTAHAAKLGGTPSTDQHQTGDPLAAALANNGTPAAPGSGGGGSIAAMREARRESLSKKKKA
jgi:hypothetical protein